MTIKNHGVDFNRWEERSGVRWKKLVAFPITVTTHD